MTQIIARAMSLVICMMLLTTTTWAGGVALYELGTPDMGTAAAGRAALGQDASTVVGNPAGMTLLDRSQLTSSLYTIIPSMHFDRGSGTTTSGGNGFEAGAAIPSLGSSASIPIPAGAFFYVHNLSPNWRLGVGLGSGFGAGLQYGKEWVGRYYVQKAQLLTTTLNPGIAYRANNWLSVGAGFSVNYALFSQTAAVNNVLDQMPDGRLKFKDEDFGFGGNVGVLVELSPQTRFGLTYRTAIDFSYEDRPTLTNVGPVASRLLNKKVKLDQTAPQAVMLSWYHALTDRLALMGNFGWQNWEEFGDIDVTVSSADASRSVTADAGLDDTWHTAIGLQYRLAESWLLSMGFAYDTSAVNRFHRTPSLPLDQTLRFGTGLQYAWSETFTLGVAYEWMHAGDAEIANLNRGPLAGTLQGEYSTNHIHFIAFNATKKF